MVRKGVPIRQAEVVLTSREKKLYPKPPKFQTFSKYRTTAVWHKKVLTEPFQEPGEVKASVSSARFSELWPPKF